MKRENGLERRGASFSPDVPIKKLSLSLRASMTTSTAAATASIVYSSMRNIKDITKHRPVPATTASASAWQLQTLANPDQHQQQQLHHQHGNIKDITKHRPATAATASASAASKTIITSTTAAIAATTTSSAAFKATATST